MIRAIITSIKNSSESNLHKLNTDAPKNFLTPISFVRCWATKDAKPNKPKIYSILNINFHIKQEKHNPQIDTVSVIFRGSYFYKFAILLSFRLYHLICFNDFPIYLKSYNINPRDNCFISQLNIY